MILDGPAPADMMYVKESSGLASSVYGGGGSSSSWLEDVASSLGSLGGSCLTGSFPFLKASTEEYEGALADLDVRDS